jgi:hypothetical protein
MKAADYPWLKISFSGALPGRAIVAKRRRRSAGQWIVFDKAKDPEAVIPLFHADSFDECYQWIVNYEKVNPRPRNKEWDTIMNRPPTLSRYLRNRSKEICADNQCTEDQHNCESYAYIDANMNLLDICAPDFFQGTSKPHAAIPLPWRGNQKDLERQVLDDCYDAIYEEGQSAYHPVGDPPKCPYKGEAAKWWRSGYKEGRSEWHGTGRN